MINKHSLQSFETLGWLVICLFTTVTSAAVSFRQYWSQCWQCPTMCHAFSPYKSEKNHLESEQYSFQVHYLRCQKCRRQSLLQNLSLDGNLHQHETLEMATFVLQCCFTNASNQPNVFNEVCYNDTNEFIRSIKTSEQSRGNFQYKCLAFLFNFSQWQCLH